MGVERRVHERKKERKKNESSVGTKMGKFKCNKDRGKNWITNKGVNKLNRLGGLIVSADTKDMKKKVKSSRSVVLGELRFTGAALSSPAAPWQTDSLRSYNPMVL